MNFCPVPKIFLPTLKDTLSLGCLLGEHLSPGIVILLNGNLGTGKTTLVQGIAQGLNISESVVSPTFTLINEYLDGRLPLYHLDLYRLEPQGVASLYPEIYWEGVEVEPGITAIEWSQRLSFRPSSYLEINLTTTSSQGRQASLQFFGETTQDLKFIPGFAQTTQKQVK